MKKIIICLFLSASCSLAIAQNVGIGIANPISKLQVAGDVRLDNGSLIINDPIGALYFRTGNQSRAFMEMRGASYDMNIGTSPLNATGKLTIQTNGTDRITVLPNGKVGIGVTNPVEALELNDDMKITDGRLKLYNSVNSKEWNVWNSSAYNLLGFFENGLARLILENGGNVGIGITPNEKLDVSGNIRTNSSLLIDNSSAILQLQNGGINTGFVQLSGDNLRFGTNSGNANGNVILRMDGTDMIEFQKTGSGGAFMQMNLNGTSTGVLQTTSTGNVSLTAVNANAQVQLGGEVFINNTANRTGIGTSSPTERLHVNGNMIVNGNAVIDDGRITGTATGSAYNLLPLAYGRVTEAGNKAGGTQNFTSAVRDNTAGYYYVYVNGVTSSSVIVVTSQSNRVASASYVNPGVFFVSLWSVANDEYSDAPFHFVVYNPQ